jgi:hypothetical protein
MREGVTVSANNWSVCPKCKAKAEAEHAALCEEAAAAYGKVPADKYRSMLKAASEKPSLQETMREDYELGVDEDGKFSVGYRALCEECGFEFSYKHTEDAMKGK